MNRTPKQARAKRIIDSLNDTIKPATHSFEVGNRVSTGGAMPVIGTVVEVVSDTSVRVQWPHLQYPRAELGERLTKVS